LHRKKKFKVLIILHHSLERKNFRYFYLYIPFVELLILTEVAGFILAGALKIMEALDSEKGKIYF